MDTIVYYERNNFDFYVVPGIIRTEEDALERPVSAGFLALI